MRDISKSLTDVAAKFGSRARWVGVIGVAILLAAVVTALSMQSGKVEGSEKLNSKSGKPYLTSDESGKLIVLDRQSGDKRVLSQDEAERLASGLKSLIKNNDEGLVEVHHADGTISMDLNGHYHNVMMAKYEPDGTLSQTCLNDLGAAAEFFEIDPKLVGVDKPVSKSRKSTELEER